MGDEEDIQVPLEEAALPGPPLRWLSGERSFSVVSLLSLRFFFFLAEK